MKTINIDKIDTKINPPIYSISFMVLLNTVCNNQNYSNKAIT